MKEKKTRKTEFLMFYSFSQFVSIECFVKSGIGWKYIRNALMILFGGFQFIDKILSFSNNIISWINGLGRIIMTWKKKLTTIRHFLGLSLSGCLVNGTHYVKWKLFVVNGIEVNVKKRKKSRENLLLGIKTKKRKTNYWNILRNLIRQIFLLTW